MQLRSRSRPAVICSETRTSVALHTQGSTATRVSLPSPSPVLLANTFDYYPTPQVQRARVHETPDYLVERQFPSEADVVKLPTNDVTDRLLTSRKTAYRVPVCSRAAVHKDARRTFLPSLKGGFIRRSSQAQTSPPRVFAVSHNSNTGTRQSLTVDRCVLLVRRTSVRQPAPAVVHRQQAPARDADSLPAGWSSARPSWASTHTVSSQQNKPGFPGDPALFRRPLCNGAVKPHCEFSLLRGVLPALVKRSICSKLTSAPHLHPAE